MDDSGGYPPLSSSVSFAPKNFGAVVHFPQPHQQLYPPSTTRLLPVKKLLASDARKSTAGAISCGSPTRRNGVNSIQRSYHSLFAIPPWLIGVFTYPGEIQLTRTPRCAHSPASDFVS